MLDFILPLEFYSSSVTQQSPNAFGIALAAPSVLAMAKSKQASLCSSGLTKTFLCYSVEKVLLSKTNPAFWEMNGICWLDVG